jgi:hypothetical protein
LPRACSIRSQASRNHGDVLSHQKDSVDAWGFWALLISLAGIGAAQQGPVPAEQEPHHHVLLKNDLVEVIHVVLPASESTLFHC